MRRPLGETAKSGVAGMLNWVGAEMLRVQGLNASGERARSHGKHTLCEVSAGRVHGSGSVRWHAQEDCCQTCTYTYKCTVLPVPFLV